jgi:two-component SAPR family response regulator
VRIIVADDEEIILSGTCALLEKLLPDDTVTAFSDSREALRYIGENGCDIAILDIEMPEISGLELAVACKRACPLVNIIFITGYSQYAAEAFRLHASGYLLKPVREADLLHELQTLRNPLAVPAPEKPYLQTFGNFELFVGGRPAHFRRKKSKEVLAYLTDRRGAAVSSRELAAVLWDDAVYDTKTSKNLYNIISDLLKDLQSCGAGDIVVRRKQELFLQTDAVECDYYRLLASDVRALNSFRGEYMSQYSWSELTLGTL